MEMPAEEVDVSGIGEARDYPRINDTIHKRYAVGDAGLLHSQRGLQHRLLRDRGLRLVVVCPPVACHFYLPG